MVFGFKPHFRNQIFELIWPSFESIWYECCYFHNLIVITCWIRLCGLGYCSKRKNSSLELIFDWIKANEFLNLVKLVESCISFHCLCWGVMRMRWWMQLLHLIGLSEWKRGINEKCNMLIVVFCDCLDDDPYLLIAKMIWWHHCRLELLEFIVSSLWCEIVYFHWFMYTMMRHVVIMTIKNSFYKWLIQSWWEMVPASVIVLMGNNFGERFYADGK